MVTTVRLAQQASAEHVVLEAEDVGGVLRHLARRIAIAEEHHVDTVAARASGDQGSDVVRARRLGCLRPRDDVRRAERHRALQRGHELRRAAPRTVGIVEKLAGARVVDDAVVRIVAGNGTRGGVEAAISRGEDT